ncbi:mucin-2-like [Trachinotus anak]|uniref:mucin-2-like n=1 Tax=Trachinotus anak TaxID=443729 RepID=UPI0039F19BDB
MSLQRWMLAVCVSLASVLGTGESVTTAENQKYTCRTFGSGVVQPFNGSGYYVRSNCLFTLTRFTHNRVECDITTRRGDGGLLVQVEIIINKVRTVLQNGSILVEKKSVSLPYDHTYQHIFQYGIYTKLRSSLLPLSVTWHNVPGGIDTLWVELEQKLSTDMTGLCGKHSVPGNKQQLITESVLNEDTCQTRDPFSAVNPECRLFFSYTLDCLQARTPHYIQLCEENIYSYENSKYISCAFFKEIAHQCGNDTYIWNIWRTSTKCTSQSCPGDLLYVEQGAAYVPSCSNPNPRLSSQDLTSSCVCPKGTVLNDHADGFHCVNVSSCPCVFAGSSYLTGDIRNTKCQSCVCEGGKWRCSENLCPARCLIEGQFVTTFDGKQYVVPGKCTYVVSQGLNWTVTVQFSQKETSLKTVVLQLLQDVYTFSYNRVKVGEEEITELHQSDDALVFWQSSMYVQVQTSFGMKMQVQMSPEIQLYITPPRNHTGIISGLCGNSNNDTTDDFTTSSGIIENSPQPFALSWTVGSCAVNIPSTCSNTDNEIFADEKCSVLNNPTGIFAKCHSHIPTDQFHTACIQRTCNCGSNLQQCLCVALGSYAEACAVLGVAVGDWRKATNCTLTCQKNQEFSYDMRVCNHTCRSLSGPDPRCWVDDAPVEGCGCPEGTHLNLGHICTPKAECVCHHYGGTTPPGPVVIDGRQCLCENGELHCSKDCGCRNGKVCVHCSELPVNTAQKTCDSLSKPLGASMTCESGCYCPHNQYEDHLGSCVSLDNCTCVYSGKVFSAGQRVKTNCKTCICGQGQWHCRDEPCPGKCQVYGNGHYQTFDSKWYRFDGHCQYTLVEDYCGNGNGTFSVRVESVPCCDEALTCSRSIVLDLQGLVTLTLSDMKVTRRLQNGWSLQEVSLYTTHTVGLYIIISVPSRGLTLIWDKHTRITIELHPAWRNRVCGLCGNFDSNEMNDLQISGSAVVSSPMTFGNSWKAATPPCSDQTTEIFPCERNSYCSAWAQRRCMIIKANIFKDCHLKVDPEPYYHACVQESCSCEFEGKFLGFCTAVAAYAEACSDQDVCVKWRTPDLCPVYCDYYNEQGQCSWHYEPCGETLTCGKGNYFTHKLEGCYPRCPKDTPYYDENTGDCTTLMNCTCFFNDTIIQPGTVVMIQSIECPCENGIIQCLSTTASPTTERTVPSTTPTTTSASTTAETWSTTPSTITTPLTTTTNVSPTSETWSTTASTMPSTTTTPLTTVTNVSTTTETWSTTASTTTTPLTTVTNVSTTTETWSTTASTTTTPLTTTTNVSPTSETWSTTASTTTTPLTIVTNVSTTTEAGSTTTSTTTTPLTITTNVSPTSETWSTTASTTTTPLTTVTNVSTTTETWSTTASTTTTPLTTTTNVSPTSETWSTTASTTTTPLTTVTNVSTTSETWSTMPSTTITPLTIVTNVSTTTEAGSTTASTTTTPLTTTTNVSPTSETWSATASTTTTPLTTVTNVSTTTEAGSTMSSTTTTPLTTTTNVSPTSETWSTTASTTTTPLMTVTNVSTTSETWSTTASTTTTPLTTVTNVSTTTEAGSTMSFTTTTPLTTTTNVSPTSETWSTTASNTTTPLTTVANVSTTTETWSTTASTTTTPLTTNTNASATSETWSTMPSTTSTPTTTTSTTTVTSVTPTELTYTTAGTTISPTTSSTTTINTTSTMTTATSTQPTIITTTIESTTEVPVVTGSVWTPKTNSQVTDTFASTATPAETSGQTEVTIATETTSITTQPTTTFSESTTSHGVTYKSTVMTPTTYMTVPTSKESTTDLTPPGETVPTMTSTMTEETYQTPVTTDLTQSTFTFGTEPTTHTTVCNQCTDLKRKKTWACGETWTEDCFHKTCTNGKIELTPVGCPEPKVPSCPRGQVVKVSDGCCETWKCDCRCELYGDPHYISFDGVTFDFLDDCTYILVEEQSPQHNLSIIVDNFYCVPGLDGSCAKGIILKYQNNMATLSIVPHLFAVQATLNNVTILPPYEEHGLRFDTTGYIVSIYLPEIRSYVSLTPSYTLVVSLAMEHFLNNTQGQCGVCGGESCIRRGGQIEDNSCCDKTAYDWVYADPLKPACISAPRDVPCHPGPTPVPTNTPVATTTCPMSPLCELLDHPAFSNCREYVNLNLTKKNCEFDSCGNKGSPCSSLEQAAEECKSAGICIEWRQLTNGSCNVTCPKGMVYRECNTKMDDFCYGGVQHSGASLEKKTTGCFCPSGKFRAGNHSNSCVSDCPYCKGPLGEPKGPGDVWQSNCNLCTCNKQTRSEECFPKPPKPAPVCGPTAVLVNTSCCGDMTCVEKNCSYNEKTYKVGDTWKDAAHPCVSFSCSKEGVQTETRVCPRENCPEEDRIWDNQHCCFTCNQSCAPKVSSFNITIDNCTTFIEIPVCQGHCVSQPRVVLRGDLQVEQKSRSCQERSSERRSVILHCSDLTSRNYAYKHITSCECRSCGILR